MLTAPGMTRDEFGKCNAACCAGNGLILRFDWSV